MPKRVSHSLLDPYLVPLVPRLYRLMHIPRWFPPEGIVVTGHMVAIAGAFGFAYSTRFWWGGLLIAAGVGGNHLADMVDGTHARSTNQCRNGGELLDHFTDPLSFSYWMIGLGVSVGSLTMALAAVLIIYATAVLTSIKAKLIGQFTLARFGPTEMKTIFVIYGLVMTALVVAASPAADPKTAAPGFFWTMLAIGALQLAWNLVASVRTVNAQGAAPDTSPWELAGQGADADREDDAASPPAGERGEAPVTGE